MSETGQTTTGQPETAARDGERPRPEHGPAHAAGVERIGAEKPRQSDNRRVAVGGARTTGPRRRNAGPAFTLYAQGEPAIWLTGGALGICLAMIIGMLLLIVLQGARTFWPSPIIHVEFHTGETYMGEVTRTEQFTPDEAGLAEVAPERLDEVRAELEAQDDGTALRRLIRTGNNELTGTHFHWVSEFRIERESRPEWALLLERREWGRFYGFPIGFEVDGEMIADSPENVWATYERHMPEVQRRWRERRNIETYEIGRVNLREERARLAMRQAEIEFERGEVSAEAVEQTRSNFKETQRWVKAEHHRLSERIAELNKENHRYALALRTADDRETRVHLADIVRAYPANQLSFFEKISIYLSRWREFLAANPREANSEGGVFPAIFGTVVMTLIMTVFVVPFGVLAALYLREYAKAGPIVSAVRIAVNNLAGVPSIVFGVFGLGFFCYIVGGYIDGGPRDPWPAWQWWTCAAVLAGMVIFAIMASSANLSTRRGEMSRMRHGLGYAAMILWLLAALATVMLIAKTPYFNGFYEARLPTPTYGKGGILWASLTLALLTLPVVIVATEEALAAVPSSMREGSYACGASKWQTIARIVLPRAMPGIMTGMILAMARGAGEVAPLMLVGAVKLAPDLPLDIYNWTGSLGFIPTGPLHADRSFMHLGFHIYDVGFQSPNSEAAKPMVYTTTLLLIGIVAFLNLSAIWLRSRLKRRFAGSAF